MKYTATYQLTGYLAEEEDEIISMYETMFGQNISVDDCDYEDCLHPCYGASHENYCHTCFLVALGKLEAEAEFVFNEDEQNVCNACSIPTKEAEPITPMTWEEYLDRLK